MLSLEGVTLAPYPVEHVVDMAVDGISVSLGPLRLLASNSPDAIKACCISNVFSQSVNRYFPVAVPAKHRNMNRVAMWSFRTFLDVRPTEPNKSALSAMEKSALFGIFLQVIGESDLKLGITYSSYVHVRGIPGASKLRVFTSLFRGISSASPSRLLRSSR